MAGSLKAIQGIERNTLRALLLVLLTLVATPATAQENQTPALKKLDEALQYKEVFLADKQEAIQMQKSWLEANQEGNPELKFDILNGLYHHYRAFVYDSAFAYANKLIGVAYQLRDPEKIGYAKIQMGFATLSAGMFKETFDTLQTVRFEELHDSSKVAYCAVMARALYDINDFNRDTYYGKIYGNRAEQYIETATSLSDSSSYHFLYLKSLQNLRAHKYESASGYLDQLLRGDIELSGNQFAIATSTQSYLQLQLGDTTRAIELLAQASISDIKSAVKETTAMTNLAELLFRRGEVETAYRYIRQAMDDADFYGAKQRKIQVGAILPVIASARIVNIDQQRRSILKYAIGISALSVLTIALALITWFQFKKLRRKDLVLRQMNDNLVESNRHLSEANKIKEEYIGYFFNINSEYLEKIETFKRSVDRKLINRQFEEIHHLLNGLNLKKEREELYYSFDKVFLKLFPNFVEAFNAHFDEDNRIKLEKDQLLNTELRIFALIRMGITDSNSLANILGYSVNTIYAYRSRVKSKSRIPSDRFEKKILEIQATP